MSRCDCEPRNATLSKNGLALIAVSMTRLICKHRTGITIIMRVYVHHCYLTRASHTLKNGPQGTGAKLSRSSGPPQGSAQLGRRDYGVSSKLLAVDKSLASPPAGPIFCQSSTFSNNIQVTHPRLSLTFETDTRNAILSSEQLSPFTT